MKKVLAAVVTMAMTMSLLTACGSTAASTSSTGHSRDGGVPVSRRSFDLLLHVARRLLCAAIMGCAYCAVDPPYKAMRIDLFDESICFRCVQGVSPALHRRLCPHPKMTYKQVCSTEFPARRLGNLSLVSGQPFATPFAYSATRRGPHGATRYKTLEDAL